MQLRSLTLLLMLVVLFALAPTLANASPSIGSDLSHSFADVDPTHWAFEAIEALSEQGFIAGCSVDPLLYCPENMMARAEASVFVVRGVHSADIIPPEPAKTAFVDVQPGLWYAKWVQQLWIDGFTAGCGVDVDGEPLFCPLTPHTRAEATVFFLRILNGQQYQPPEAIIQAYDDVAVGGEAPWFSRWVNDALASGIVGECEDEGNRVDNFFRPDDGLTRAEAACMMVRAKRILMPSAARYSPTNRSNTNPCAEGYFRDLNDNNVCKRLVKPQFGFNIEAFDQDHGPAVRTLDVCSESGLRDLLSNLPSSGGTINLPACTIVVTSGIEIPGNVLVQGAGSGRTFLRAGPGFSGHLIEVNFAKNIVLRDLTIDGSGGFNHPLLIWYAQNILVERVEVADSERTGISFRYSSRVTIRYSQSHGAGAWHGIESKDCPNSDPKPTLAECESAFESRSNQDGTTQPGVLWTQSYAVYSNEVFQNGTHGLNLHATFGEVAGNFSHDNQYGSKFFDARNVWIHNNKFSNNRKSGTHVNTSINIPALEPNQLIFYDNQFVSNGHNNGGSSDYVFRIADPSHNIYLINNTYSSNAKEELRISAAAGVVKICVGSQEASLPIAGNATSFATSAECDNPQLLFPTMEGDA